jgi:hypothetical protein
VLTTTGFAQRKYYEYNNPDAIKLDRKRIDMLTSTSWKLLEREITVRNHRSSYARNQTITYEKNGNYSVDGMPGKWKVEYDRYLVLTPDSTVADVGQALTGIYAVTSISDSTLTLVKLHSSSRDMTTKMSLIKHSSKIEIDDRFTKVKIFSEIEDPQYRIDMQRFTLEADLVRKVDSLALSYMRKRGDAAFDKIQSTEPYFRQYVGYDYDGNRVVFLNAFSSFHGSWKNAIVSAPKQRSFRIYVNLTTGECFGLSAKE